MVGLCKGEREQGGEQGVGILPALSTPRTLLLVPCPPAAAAEEPAGSPPHSRAESGLKERKRKVKTHRAMRARSSIPTLPAPARSI